MATGYPCMDNRRMQQVLRHAKVRIRAVGPDRAVIENMDDGPIDPITRIIMHLEPSSIRGAEHMPSLEEAIAMGLVKPDN